MISTNAFMSAYSLVISSEHKRECVQTAYISMKDEQITMINI